jgi:hypothetical protein
MAMPILYWMLECTRCGARRVVYGCYLELVSDGEHDASADEPERLGAGYGGRPLPERYGCLEGCPETPRVIGSVFSPDDEEMWLHTPHEPRPMDARQRREWVRLIAQGDEARGARGPIARARAAVARWLRS